MSGFLEKYKLATEETLMKILYIQPWDRPWTDSSYISRRSSMYLSRSQFEVGWQIPAEFGLRFLDLNLALKEGKSIRTAVITELHKSKPDFVLVSWSTYVLGDQVRSIIETVRSECPKIRIIVGGAVLSLIHQKPLCEWPAVSACYNGYGLEIPEILSSLANSEKGSEIPGLYTRYSGNGFTAGKPVLVSDYPAEEFYTSRGRLNFEEYVSRCHSVGLMPLGLIEMSRGCRFRCEYCAINYNRIGFHLRSVKTVVQESRFLAMNGIVQQQLIDPTLGLDPVATTKLLHGLSEVAHEFPALSLEVLTRPEFVTDKFAELLRSAGVKRCALGMETMDQSELARVRKTLRISMTSKAVYKLAERGIEVKLFHIMFPKRYSWSTVRFLSELQQQGVKFVVQSSFLRPLAHPESGSDYLSYDHTVFVPTYDSLEQLKEWLVVNLAFPSMDVGLEGNPDLQELVAKAASAQDLLNRFEIRRGSFLEVWLTANGRSYGYVHPQRPRAVADCLFMR